MKIILSIYESGYQGYVILCEKSVLKPCTNKKMVIATNVCSHGNNGVKLCAP